MLESSCHGPHRFLEKIPFSLGKKKKKNHYFNLCYPQRDTELVVSSALVRYQGILFKALNKTLCEHRDLQILYRQMKCPNLSPPIDYLST